MGDGMGRGGRERLRRPLFRDLLGWGILSALSAIAVHLGSFWFAGSWLLPATLGVSAVALVVGLAVGDRRAARSGRHRPAEAVRYGLLFAMLWASAVGLVLLAWMFVFMTLVGGWAA
jgi:hypothetical protein